MDIYKTLNELNIPFARHDHPAVFTVEEAEIHCKNIPGGQSKNLFLRNRKGDKYFLVVIEASKKANLKKLGDLLGEKLSFASPKRLLQYLGVTPGSVTLLGLINDTNKKVNVIIDADLWKNDSVQFHPLINTATLVIKREDLEKFLQSQKNKVQYATL